MSITCKESKLCCLVTVISGKGGVVWPRHEKGVLAHAQYIGVTGV